MEINLVFCSLDRKSLAFTWYSVYYRIIYGSGRKDHFETGCILKVSTPPMSSNPERRLDPRCIDEMLYSQPLSGIFAFWEHHEAFRLVSLVVTLSVPTRGSTGTMHFKNDQWTTRLGSTLGA